MLDIGGGTGGFAVPLAQAGHRVTVLDHSPDALAGLGRRVAEAGVAAQVRAVQGDADNLAAAVAGSDGAASTSCSATASSSTPTTRPAPWSPRWPHCAPAGW